MISRLCNMQTRQLIELFYSEDQTHLYERPKLRRHRIPRSR